MFFLATQYGAIFFTQERSAVAESWNCSSTSASGVIPFKPNENEEGFLGLAFHPKFKENGEFFVYYTAKPTEGASASFGDLAVPRVGRRSQSRPIPRAKKC